MKYYLIIILALLCFNLGWAQTVDDSQEPVEEEVEINLDFLSKYVSMDIDQTQFPNTTEQGHFSEDNQSAIMGQLLPITFEQMRRDFEGGAIETRFDTLEKEILEIDDKLYLYIKQYAKQEGNTMIVVMYARQHDESSSVLVSGFYQAGSDAELLDAQIKKAALSATIKDKQ